MEGLRLNYSPDAGAARHAGINRSSAALERELTALKRKYEMLRAAFVRAEALLRARDRRAAAPAGTSGSPAMSILASARGRKLTARQHQILKLVLDGHPSKNIAADLGISRRTVETHRAAIMRKTGSKSLAALCRFGLSASRPAAGGAETASPPAQAGLRCG